MAEISGDQADTTASVSQSRIGGPPIRQFGIFPWMSLLDHNASAAGMADGDVYRRAADTVLGLSSSHLESRPLSADTDPASADTDPASADRARSPKLDRQLNPGSVRQQKLKPRLPLPYSLPVDRIVLDVVELRSRTQHCS